MAHATNGFKLSHRVTVFKRKMSAVRRAEYNQLAMAIFALWTGKVDYEAM
jgi:hypothetical protein